MRGPSADTEYARFLEATLGLADASAGLSRRARFGMAVALLHAHESDRVARVALIERSPRRLAEAAAGIRRSRARLAEAGHDAKADARRRRLLKRVA